MQVPSRCGAENEPGLGTSPSALEFSRHPAPMKHKHIKSRRKGLLGTRLEKSIAAYSIAAAGMVSLAPAAHAQVVYTRVDQVNDLGAVKVDFNVDHVVDFVIANQLSFENGFYFPRLGLNGRKTPMAGVIPNQSGYAGVLGYGFSIGSNAQFASLNHRRQIPLVLLGCLYQSCSVKGSWYNVQDQYLGLRFEINGQVHYGWVRLSVKRIVSKNRFDERFLKVAVKDYAYESTPGKAIAAGDGGPSESSYDPNLVLPGEFLQAVAPPSLGLLSAGASAIPLWRRE